MNTEIATIGDNRPPEPTPFEAVADKINDLYAEAKQWLDGEPITTQGQADELNKLINLIREAEKDADALRKDEAKPFDDAKAEIQTRYNPLISKNKASLGKTARAIDAAKVALTPWLKILDERKREAERVAAEKAATTRLAAEEALRQSRADDLAAREAAEELVQDAKHADIAHRMAKKDKAHAKGGEGRATGLRTHYRAEVTDPIAFAGWLWERRQTEIAEFLQATAKRMVDENPNQEIPGVTIHEDRRAV